MNSILGFDTVEEIAKYIIREAKEYNLRVTLEVEPGKYELSVEPWENVIVYCPYHQKEIKN